MGVKETYYGSKRDLVWSKRDLFRRRVTAPCMVCAACLAEWLGGGDPLGVAEDDLHLEGLPCPSCGCYLDGRTFTCRTQGKFVQGVLALKGWPLDYAPAG